MLAAAVAYGIAFSEPVVEFGFLVLEVVVIHLFLASAALATLAWALASTRLKSDAVSKHATGGAKVRLFCFTIFCRDRRHPFAPIPITPACALMLPQQHNAFFFPHFQGRMAVCV
jgi:hypothetical protein